MLWWHMQAGAASRSSAEVRDGWRTVAGVLALATHNPKAVQVLPHTRRGLLGAVLEAFDCASEDAVLPLLHTLR